MGEREGGGVGWVRGRGGGGVGWVRGRGGGVGWVKRSRELDG